MPHTESAPSANTVTEYMDEALTGMKDFRKIVDDVVFDHDEQEHVEHVRQLLQ